MPKILGGLVAGGSGSWSVFLEVNQVGSASDHHEEGDKEDVERRDPESDEIGVEHEERHHGDREREAQSEALEAVDFALPEEGVGEAESWEEEDVHGSEDDAQGFDDRVLLVGEAQGEKRHRAQEHDRESELQDIYLIFSEWFHRGCIIVGYRAVASCRIAG